MSRENFPDQAEKRHCLGVWRCPSGITITVYLEPDDGAPLREWTCECHPTGPRSEEDLIDWGIRIRPGIVASAKEYLEVTGPVWVLQQ